MARRRQLKGVAANIAQTCVSRNFDCEGYWTVGMLYAHAEKNETESVVLNLIDCSCEPEPKTTKFVQSIKLLSDILEHNATANQIPIWWVTKAVVSFQFNTGFQKKYHLFGSALGGKPFTCSASISTDLGGTYTYETGGNVWPHNPARESRRYGF